MHLVNHYVIQRKLQALTKFAERSEIIVAPRWLIGDLQIELLRKYKFPFSISQRGENKLLELSDTAIIIFRCT